jgi:hypothetical protein
LAQDEGKSPFAVILGRATLQPQRDYFRWFRELVILWTSFKGVGNKPGGYPKVPVAMAPATRSDDG